ncbi:GAF domain-containing protein [Pikeienuella piscinae]|uniref:histidine kinase n=1 Tax=Pikeienuella piscinae TaxID=2748098 RepID=A0A7L5C2X0_9RHOB|nr:ATP-binding protein [Pikeienuella piscinae]QIE56906.1 GAF domain-containing protein [Pikeienuella piscinae]
MQREELFRIFNKFAVDIMGIDGEQELMWHVAREVVGKMGFNDCVIYLTDPLGAYLRQVAALGAKNPEGHDIVNSLRIRMGQGVTGRVAQTGKPIIISDLSKEPSYIPDLEPALSEICVPMTIDGKVVGVIDSEEASANVFTAGHLSILTTIAAIVSSKLKLLREAEDARRRNLELERTRERLDRARRQAESASRVKNAFLGTLSHELRTPMNGVIGMGELLSHTDLDDRQRQFVDVLLASAKSLTGLMDDLLDISMIEAGEMRLQIADVDLAALAHTLTEAIAAMEVARQTRLTLDFDDSARGLWRGDGKRIRQILSNLINNAVKFTGEGEVAVTIRAEDTHVRFEVKDDGPGVPKEQLSAIFDRFQQVEQTESRRHGGVGIGLNICRQLVAAMKGEIGIESEEGKGALFWFNLPLERVKTQTEG